VGYLLDIETELH